MKLDEVFQKEWDNKVATIKETVGVLLIFSDIQI